MTMPYRDPVTWEDAVLFLYLYGCLDEGIEINQIQEQKLFFLSQYNACQAEGILSRVRFMRHKFGPVAPHIYDMERHYEEAGFVEKREEKYIEMDQVLRKLTPAGWEILDELEELLKDPALQLVDKTVTENIEVGGPKRGWNLRQDVYAIKIDGRAIRDFKKKEVIPTTPTRPAWIWEIPSDWLYTVKYLLTPGNLKELKLACTESAAASFIKN
jgi:hypothetical protein